MQQKTTKEIKLGTLKGMLTEHALDQIAKPMRKTGIKRRFGKSYSW
jgi:hypothetical protein